MSEEHRTKTFLLFNEEFEKESERAKVILSAAMIDEALMTVLKASFLPNASSTDSLFDGPNAPVSSFSSRIDFAYRLGKISKRFSRDLHIIRKIRNEFAHNVTGCTFDTSSVSSRVASLKGSFKTLINAHEKKYDKKLETIEQFQEIVGWAIFHLWGLVEKIVPVSEKKEEWGYDVTLPQKKEDQND